MTYRKYLSILFASFCVVLTFLAPPSEASTIRVLLANGVSSAVISSARSVSLQDASGKRTTHPHSVHCTPVSSRSVLVDGKMRTLPLTLSSSAPLAFGKARYRGAIRVVPARAGLSVINVVDSETYLRGVLKMEANPAWPTEALKAQAIVSRTYALRRVSGSGGREYDVSDSIESQVYRGVNAEDPRCDAAIRSTAGLILSYAGAVAFTPFHSDSGGNTADIRDVWGGSYPYLSGAKEPIAYDSPNSSWKTRLPAATVESILSRMNKSVGRVTNVTVQSSDAAGRAVTLLVSGSNGRVTVRAHDFRMAAGPSVLRSTAFSITPEGDSSVPRKSGAMTAGSTNRAISPTPAQEKSRIIPVSSTPMSFREEEALTALTEKGVFSAEELIDMLKRPETRKGYLIEAINRSKNGAPQGIATIVPANASGGQSFLFTGRGWGHGVGMSQWGAKSLAESGWTYTKILQHYFPGTELTRR
jgi:stage II sporulation protein D